MLNHVVVIIQAEINYIGFKTPELKPSKKILFENYVPTPNIIKMLHDRDKINMLD